MNKKVILSMFIALFFVGCGGDLDTSATNLDSAIDTRSGDSGSYINPDDIDLQNDIDSGKVADYDANGDRDDNYLAVVNYLRSLSIKCNDDLALEGPSPKLEWNELLKDAAYEHSKDMGEQDYFEHDGSGKDTDITAQAYSLNRGSKFNERIEYSGYNYSVSGENIAMYATKPNQPPENSWIKAMEGLIKSRHGHCSNIMNKGFTEMGVAEYRTSTADSDGWYKAYWTQDFGTPR